MKKALPEARKTTKNIALSAVEKADKPVTKELGVKVEKMFADFASSKEITGWADTALKSQWENFSRKSSQIGVEMKAVVNRVKYDASEGKDINRHMKDVFKQASSLGIQKDELTGMLSQGKFKDAADMIRNVAKQQDELKMLKAVSSEAAEMFVEPKLIEKIFNDSTLSMRGKTEEILKARKLASEVVKQGLGIEPIKPMGLFNKAFTGVNEKVGRGFQYFNEVGMPYVSKVLGEFGAMNDMSGVLRTKVTRTATQLSNTLKSFPEKERLAVRHYLQNVKTRNEYMSLGNAKKSIMVDRNALQATQQKYGIKLSEDHIKLANKVDEFFRRTKLGENRRKAGIYETSYLPRGADELSGYDMDGALKQYLGNKDIVHGYWHAQATPEYVMQIKEKHPELTSVFEKLAGKEHYRTASHIDRARFSDSRLRGLNEDMNRLDPADEIMSYANKWIDQEVRQKGINLLQQAKAGVAMPLSEVSSRNIPNEWQFIKDIENHFVKNMNPKTYSDMNGFQKLLHTYIGAVIPVALSSPRMAISNSFQSVFTGGSNQGYINHLKNTAKMQTLFAKEVVMNPAKLQKVMDRIGKGVYDKPLLEGVDGTVGKNFIRWWKEQPGLHTMVDEDFKHLTSAIESKSGKSISNTISENIKSFLTFGFESSDKISRGASFMAATEHATVHTGKFVKNIENGMKLEEAVAKLVKDTHLGTFRQHDIHHVMSAIDPKNLKKTMGEFIYRYSDRAVKQQIFDYSTSGQSYLKAYLKGIDPTLGAVTTFTSWPMYFHELVLGSARAYKNGDPKPLLSLIAGGVGTYMGASYAMTEDSEYTRGVKSWIEREGGMAGKLLVNQAEGFPGYIKARAPGLSYAMFVEKAISSPAGILTPAVGAAFYPIFKGLQGMSELAGVDAADDPLMFTTRKMSKAMQSDIMYRKLVQLTKGMQEAGMIDWNAQDKANEFLKEGD